MQPISAYNPIPPNPRPAPYVAESISSASTSQPVGLYGRVLVPQSMSYLLSHVCVLIFSVYQAPTPTPSHIPSAHASQHSTPHCSGTPITWPSSGSVGPQRSVSSPLPRQNAQPYTKTPSEAMKQQSKARMGRQLEAAEVYALQKKKEQAASAAWKVCKELGRICPACFALKGLRVPHHPIGSSCKEYLSFDGYLDISMGWIAFKNNIKIKDELLPIRFCFGCLMPFGSRWAHDTDVVGNKCAFNDFVSNLVWTVFKVDNWRQMLQQEFFGDELIMDIKSFSDWCVRPHDEHIVNYLSVFLWVCHFRGFQYCKL